VAIEQRGTDVLGVTFDLAAACELVESSWRGVTPNPDRRRARRPARCRAAGAGCCLVQVAFGASSRPLKIADEVREESAESYCGGTVCLLGVHGSTVSGSHGWRSPRSCIPASMAGPSSLQSPPSQSQSSHSATHAWLIFTALARCNGIDRRDPREKADGSKNLHTGLMRSQPNRSRPMRGKRPRYIGGRPRPRPQADKRCIRRAVARATQPSGTFARCPGPRDGHSLDSHRANGARCAGASTKHDPATRSRLGRAARRVAERSRWSFQGATKRLVAGRSQSSCPTTRTGPDCLSLLVNEQQRGNRTRRFDRHAYAPPSPCRHPGSATGTGRERVERTP
jgi:hypothetical protein